MLPEHANYTYDKADARLGLLRALVEGKRCLNRDRTRFMTDCGRCVVCAFKSEDGAVRFMNERGLLASIPGTPEIRRLHDELVAAIADG